MFDALRRLFARATPAEAYPESSRINYSGRTHAGVHVTPDRALQNAVVWAAHRFLTQTVAQLPVRGVLRVEADARRPGRSVQVRVPNHPVEWVLAWRTNPELGPFQFRETLMGWAVLWGNGYAEIERDMAGRVVALWPLHPSRVAAVRDQGTGTLSYVVDPGSAREKTLDPMDMFHLRGFGNDVVGLGVIEYAAQSIGWAQATELFSARYFGSGMLPSGVIEGANLQPEGVKRARAEMDSLHSGWRNAHRWAILPEGAKATLLSRAPNESQFIECCVPGTLVSLADGSRKPVETLRAGDRVLGWNDGLVPATVAAVGRPPLKPLVRVTTARGRTLTTSSDHPYLGIPAMRTAGARPLRTGPDWIMAGDLEPGNYVRVAIGHPAARADDMTDRLTFRRAYLLGALTGDGCVRKGACGFTSATQEVLAAVGESLADQGAELRVRGGHDYFVVTNGDANGSPFRTLVNESGLVGCRSHEKRAPASVLSGGPDAWRGFLSGMVDTDGCIVTPKRAQQAQAVIASTSRGLLDDCQHLLAMLGMNSSLRLHTGGGRRWVVSQMCETLPLWNLHICGAEMLSRLRANLRLSHPMRAARLEKCGQQPASRYSDMNFLFDRVVQVETLGLGETIGIEIEGIHTHVTNGLITHNTKQYQVEEISRWFGVPPHKVQHLLRSTFGNIEHQAIEVVVDSITPWVVRFEDECNYKLFGQNRPGYFIKLDLKGLLRGDFKSRQEGLQIMRRNGIINANDWCELEDMPLIGEDGDKYVIEANMTTLEQVGKVPEPAPVALPAPEPETPEPSEDTTETMRALMADADRLMADAPAS